MPEPTPRGQQRVVLYVRADLPEPTRRRLEAISARLEGLVADGQLASYTTTTWAKQTRTDAEDSQWSRYVSFRKWARTTGVDLSPAFETRRCYSMETGECAERLVYPVVCMAVYADEQLRAVYPHEQDGECRSVFDGLRSLGTADPDQHERAVVNSSASD